MAGKKKASAPKKSASTKKQKTESKEDEKKSEEHESVPFNSFCYAELNVNVSADTNENI